MNSNFQENEIWTSNLLRIPRVNINVGVGANAEFIDGFNKFLLLFAPRFSEYSPPCRSSQNNLRRSLADIDDVIATCPPRVSAVFHALGTPVNMKRLE